MDVEDEELAADAILDVVKEEMNCGRCAVGEGSGADEVRGGIDVAEG